MTLLALVRFHLRRHRLLFVSLLALLVLHDLLLTWIFQFWREQREFSDMILTLVPGRIRQGLGIPLTDLTDPRTYKAIVFMRPDFRALTVFFGVALGTDVIAGEVGRGTADLLFAHPVRRTTAVLAGVVTTLLHLLCVGAVLLLSFLLSTRLFPMGANQPKVAQIAPSILLVIAAGLALSLLAFLAGSFCRTRTRAVGVSLLLLLVPMVLDFMGVFTQQVVWIARLFPEHYYRPHTILFGIDDPSLPECLGALAVIAAVALAGALVGAQRRDLAA